MQFAPAKILVLFVMFLLFVSGLSFADDKSVVFSGDNRKKLCSFKVELASTPREQEKGLMFRKSLGKNRGMLFIYNNDDIRFFWMKNTLISLDIIFIDSKFKISDIYYSAKPYDESTIGSKAPARYVLEINAGMAESCNLRVGTEVSFMDFSAR